MDRKYLLVVRTGEAEIQALQNFDNDVFSNVLPLIELTRGRKKTIGNSVSYPFDNRFEKIKNKLRGQKIALDVTSDEGLACAETECFYNYEQGYSKWVKFLVDLKRQNIFEEIIPTLLMNFEDEYFDDNFRKEIHSLLEEFGGVLYRCSLDNDDCYEDLSIIQDELGNSNKLYVVIDYGYVVQAMQHNVSDKCKARIANLHKMLKCNYDIIVCGTSFPNNISDIGDDEHDSFSISEVAVFEDCYAEDDRVVYGDYGSVNPKRNDDIVMARGWVPRIDVPLENSVFYYRQRRPKELKYKEVYKNVAKEVLRDPQFPNTLNVWGTSMIRQCAYDVAPSARPSFWIAVRMDIHVAQQLKRLNYL